MQGFGVIIAILSVHSAECFPDCCRGICPWSTRSTSSQPRDTKIKARLRKERPVVRGEPIHVALSKYSRECLDIISILPVFPRGDSVPLEMQQVCESRFQELYTMHAQNQIALRQGPGGHQGSIDEEAIKANGREANNTRAHLLVLDLDETLVDQVSVWLQFS